MRALLAALLLWVPAAANAAQTIILRNGTVIGGTVLSSQGGVITIQTGVDVVRVRASEVLRIEGTPDPPQPTPPPRAAPGATPQPFSKREDPLDAHGSAEFTFGGKLASDDWRPVEKQGEIGIQGTWTPVGWPASLALDGFYSDGRGHTRDTTGTVKVNLNGTSFEVAGGARKIFRAGSLHPYAGAGVMWARAAITADKGGATGGIGGTGYGLWVGAGVWRPLGTRGILGIMGRYSWAQTNIQGNHVNVGGAHLALTFGFPLPLPDEPRIP